MPALRLCVFCGELSRLGARCRRMRWQPNRLGGGWQAEIRTPNVFSWPGVTAVPVWFAGLGGTWLRPSPAQTHCAKVSNPGSKWAPRKPGSPSLPLPSRMRPEWCLSGAGTCMGGVIPRSAKGLRRVENEGPLRDFQPHLILFVVCT